MKLLEGWLISMGVAHDRKGHGHCGCSTDDQRVKIGGSLPSTQKEVEQCGRMEIRGTIKRFRISTACATVWVRLKSIIL
jgi:hypothetical protein